MIRVTMSSTLDSGTDPFNTASVRLSPQNEGAPSYSEVPPGIVISRPANALAVPVSCAPQSLITNP